MSNPTHFGQAEPVNTLSCSFQIALWGNKADLSISSGEQHDHADSPLKQVETLRDHILLNDLPMVLDRLFHE